MNKYISVSWPEVQDFMGHPRYEEIGFDANKNLWFVPENLYNEIYSLKV